MNTQGLMSLPSSPKDMISLLEKTSNSLDGASTRLQNKEELLKLRQGEWRQRLNDSMALRGKASKELQSMLDVLIEQAREYTQSYSTERGMVQTRLKEIRLQGATLKETISKLREFQKREDLRRQISFIATDIQAKRFLPTSSQVDKIDHRMVQQLVLTAQALIEMKELA